LGTAWSTGVVGRCVKEKAGTAGSADLFGIAEGTVTGAGVLNAFTVDEVVTEGAQAAVSTVTVLTTI